ncbi:MAG: type II toxin-antitoxin system Phd/YefM family antitoxin [Ktedonobacterales bacterium]
MSQVTPDEAKSRLLELIEAALHGETVLIAEDETHVVQLVPVSRAKRQRKAGSAKGTIQMSPDFDAPLPEFEEYMR